MSQIPSSKNMANHRFMPSLSCLPRIRMPIPQRELRILQTLKNLKKHLQSSKHLRHTGARYKMCLAPFISASAGPLDLPVKIFSIRQNLWPQVISRKSLKRQSISGRSNQRWEILSQACLCIRIYKNRSRSLAFEF